MNLSYKNKNKKNFLEEVSNLWSDCIDKNPSLGLEKLEKEEIKSNGNQNSFKEIKRTHSFSFDSHEIEGIEIKILKEILKLKEKPNSYINKRHSVKILKNNEDENPFNDSIFKQKLNHEKSLNHFISQSDRSTFYTDVGLSSFKSISTNFENIVTQNLYLSEDTIKIILIGEKAVGKTFFVERIYASSFDYSPCKIQQISTQENTNNNSNYNYLNLKKKYNPTTSLDIKKMIVHIINKFSRLEIWDTNEKIINSGLITTYYKLCHGIILICDIASIESIKFIEKQFEVIISTKENLNIFLIANIKNDVDVNEYYDNLIFLNYFCEKYMIKPNYINMSEYNFKKDHIIQKFFNNCIIKKGSDNKISRQKVKKRVKTYPHKFTNHADKNIDCNTNFINGKQENDSYQRNLSESDYKINKTQIQSQRINKNTNFDKINDRDMSLSPRNSKKCIIF